MSCSSDDDDRTSKQPPTKQDKDNNNVKTDDDTHLQRWLRPDCYNLYKTHIFPQSTAVKKRAGVLRFSMNMACNVKTRYPKALFLEFGVATGKDIIRMMHFLSHKQQHLAMCEKSTIHGFDSFHGLPEPWDNGQVDHETGQGPLFRLGHFDAGGHAPILDTLQQEMRVCHHGSNNNNNDNNNNNNQCPVEFHAGWFHDSVPAFFANPQYCDNNATTTTTTCSPIAFLHADADLYSSTLTFLNEICVKRLLIPGSVILFDEYANYQNWQDGEYKAWMEICARYDIDFLYLCHHAPPNTKMSTIAKKNFTLSAYGYQSVSVMITNVGGRE
jgi:Macrocin-O-methyltransferase (TylF)